MISIDRYALTSLMRDLIGHDGRPAAYLVYLAITVEAEERAIAMSHQEIADRTGLSKRGVQDAIAHLARRQLIAIERRGRTEAASIRPLTPWRR